MVYIQEAQRTYLCVLGLILLVSVYVPLRHNDENAKLWGRVGYLHLTYISIVAFGIYPAIHWVELHGGISHPHVVVRTTELHLSYGRFHSWSHFSGGFHHCWCCLASLELLLRFTHRSFRNASCPVSTHWRHVIQFRFRVL